jgi:hypothetical protein
MMLVKKGCIAVEFFPFLKVGRKTASGTLNACWADDIHLQWQNSPCELEGLAEGTSTSLMEVQQGRGTS